MENVFIRVDPVWTYNFLGGLKEALTLDYKNVSEIFSLVGSYLVARHNFHVTKDAVTYNAFYEAFTKYLHQFEIYPTYFIHSFDHLYRLLKGALDCMAKEAKTFTMINDIEGEITGIVFGLIESI
jgi:hypothetical protein